jgi:hypothetical protein
MNDQVRAQMIADLHPASASGSANLHTKLIRVKLDRSNSRALEFA